MKPIITKPMLQSWAICLTTALTVSCSTDKVSTVGKRNSEAKAEKKAKKTPGAKATAGDEVEIIENGGELAPGDSEGGSDGGGNALAQTMKECGVDPAKLADPAAQLSLMNLTSLTKVITGGEKSTKWVGPIPVTVYVEYEVRLKVAQGIDAKTAQTIQSTNPSLLSARATNLSGPLLNMANPEVISKAQADLNAQRGSSTSTSLTTEQLLELTGSNEQWSGILCIIQPVSEMVVKKGAYTKTVRFTPALPSTVSPLALASRYESEIGQGRTFTGIKAEVVSSNDPAMPAGRVFTGSVTINKAANSFDVPADANDGVASKISAEAGYKIGFNFGNGVADTVGIGLMPAQTFLVNHSTQKLAWVAAETGDPRLKTLVLKNPE